MILEELSDSIRASTYITITSLEDGAQQRLDARSLPQWNNSSAYFNGDAVVIELHVAPGDSAVFFRINAVSFGEAYIDTALKKTITQCGFNDDRTTWFDQAVGRIVPAGCTGWIVSNGAHLTAGHCVGVNMDILEFNVPPSDPDGSINHPDPDDQYPIEANSIVWNDDGIGEEGDDWAVFACNPNSNTGLLPVQAQLAFYRMSRDSSPSDVQVTGYGVDFEPAGDPGGPCQNYDCAGNNDCNSNSQTQQTESGSYNREDVQGPADVVIEYRVDTECGNSGSPVIVASAFLAMGIHTNGGCGIFFGNNAGTGFENNDLEAAIQDFPGSNVTYADKAHPVTLEDGTVLRPYDTIGEAVSAVSSSGTISAVTGYYNEFMTISKAMTITAPVGVVTIGASGPSASVQQYADTKAEVVQETDPSIPTVYSLSPSYPNPFNPITTLRFGLPGYAEVTLVVYNLLGREVVRLADGPLGAAYHQVVWHGRDSNGREVPSGLYIARIIARPTGEGRQASSFTQSVKMVLLR